MSHVAISERDTVAVLTVDRPPANALDVELLGELNESLERLARSEPSALVLAGRAGCFSAGVDLKAVPTYGRAEQRRMVEAINTLALGWYGLDCPVVCAVTGHAIAGGLVLALCGDYRVASTEGRYGLSEVTVDVRYPQAAIGVVRAELSATAARLLALRSRLVDAAECLRLGVFDEAVLPDAVLSRAVTVAGELAALPSRSYACTKAELRGESLARMRAAAECDPLLDGWLPR